MMMNDPHVKAIHYFVEHDDSVDYRDVAPLVFEDDLFRVSAEKVQVVFEPKNHYATEEEARSAVGGLVRRWEFEVALQIGSRAFKLVYARVDIVDRNPPQKPPGVVRVDPVHFHFRVSQPQVQVTKMLAEYPALPSVQTLEPDDPRPRQRHQGAEHRILNLFLCMHYNASSRTCPGRSKSWKSRRRDSP